MSYELVEFRNDWHDERNAGFGEEYRNAPWDHDERNAYVQRRNPRTGRMERVWVADQQRPVAIVRTQPTPIVMQQPAQPVAPAATAAATTAAATPAGNITCGKSPFRNEMGQVRTGVIIDAIAQTLAAFAPLPVTPTPTGDIADDQANGITFLAALAQHAKTDEKIRTVSKLVQLFVTN